MGSRLCQWRWCQYRKRDQRQVVQKRITVNEVQVVDEVNRQDEYEEHTDQPKILKFEWHVQPKNVHDYESGGGGLESL